MSLLASSPKASVRSACEASKITHTAVGDALSQSSYATLGLVEYEIEGDHVVLRGEVPSYYLKQMAQAVVQRLAGVGRVDNRLSVSRPAGSCL
jgi:osmotically-inducible protein OsmY